MVATHVKVNRRPPAHRNTRRVYAAVVTTTTVDACPSREATHRAKHRARFPTHSLLLVRPHCSGNEDKRPVRGGIDISGRVVGEGYPNRFVTTEGRPMIGKFCVLLHCQARDDGRLLQRWEEYADLGVSDMLLGRESAVDRFGTSQATRNDAIAVCGPLIVRNVLHVPRALHGQVLLDDRLVHVVGPWCACRGVGRIVDVCMRSKSEMTGESTSTTTTTPASAIERTKSIGRRSRASVIVHEESAPVGHERRILIPLSPVFIMLATTTLEGGFDAGVGSQLHSRGRSRADYDGRCSLDGRLLVEVIKVDFLNWSSRICERQPVQHYLGIRHDRLDGLFGILRIFSTSGPGYPICRCLAAVRCRRCVINIAGIAIVGGVVIIADQRAFGQGVVV
ncbi:hypothetical protein ACKVWC_011584 [Pyricularia oryzae]